MGKLTAAGVRAIKAQGRYSDGNGLLLVCKASGAKSWILRVQHNGRRRDFGLGSYDEVSLSEAREKALETRKLVRNGGDPSAAKNDSRRILGQSTTFEGVARQYYDERKGDWHNPKHRRQWLSTLETYAFPTMGACEVSEVTSRHIREAVAPIWNQKQETARRVLQRITSVLDYAHSIELRESEAPTRSVRAGLGRQKNRPQHHASLPYDQMPKLMNALAQKEAIGALALRFTILTAARSGEVRRAKWDEVDWDEKVWIRPAEHMKAGIPHSIPLSGAALEILKLLEPAKRTEAGLIFPSDSGKPLSDMTLLKAIKTASGKQITVHGCRSSFRDWVAERTSYPAAAAEAALAHTIQNKAEAAYHRTDYLEVRRAIMRDWADCVTSANSQSSS